MTKASKRAEAGKGPSIDRTRDRGESAGLLAEAFRHHTSDALDKARDLYGQILTRTPDHPDALHLLGVLCYQAGELASSEEHIRRALAVRPRAPEYHCSMGNTLSGMGRHEEAISFYQEAVALKPDYAEACNNLGACLRAVSRVRESIECYLRAVEIRPDYGTAYRNLANAYKEAGELDRAVWSYRRALRVRPDCSETFHSLGTVHWERGEHEEAVSCFRKSLELNPRFAGAYESLARLYWSAGRDREAEEACLEALDRSEGTPVVHHLLGEAHYGAGRYREAERCFLKELEKDPGSVQGLNSLGLTLQHLGRTEEALSCYEKALEIDPGYVQAHTNLGNTLVQMGRADKAIASHEKAVALCPESAEAHNNMGSALLVLNRPEEAGEYFRKATVLNPDFAEAHLNLSLSLQMLGRFDEARACIRRALEIRPGYVQAHISLGDVLREKQLFTEALAEYRRAFELDPGSREGYARTAGVLTLLGMVPEAIRHYRKALEIDPGHTKTRSSFLMTLHYQDSIDPVELRDLHREMGSVLDRILPACGEPHLNDRTTGRRLRIGYVSPDFRTHSVACFIEPVLACHNTSAFEVFCYADISSPDDTTRRMQTMVMNWRDIRSLSDERVASMIREDAIDILVDLAGHTAGNRLPLFARKPAPVQVTYLGYPGTTGIPAMDWRITDRYSDPPGVTDHHYTEGLMRLPHGFLCYRPPDTAPEVCPPPGSKTGVITFGSFNNRSKITPSVVRVWSEILKRVPGSRLILKAKVLSDPGARDFILDAFARSGVEPGRITCLGHVEAKNDHLALYGSIDIALDTFPYNGTTTTCEALWMGVPVIALEGMCHASRVGVSILSHAGLADLIAGTEEEYVQKAVELARDAGRLESLRSGLRGKMASSPLMDAAAFTRSLEDIYKSIWHTFCSTNLHESEEDDMEEGRNSMNLTGQQEEASRALTQEGEVHFTTGRVDEAMKAFVQAIETNPRNVSALNNLGVLFWSLGDGGRAIENFELVLKIEPDNEDAAHNLQMIREALKDATQGQSGEENPPSGEPDDGCLHVNIRGGVKVCVPPSIDHMTPYILVEQEDWFEDEIHFIRKAISQGMNIIDIGANYGLYTLTMASLIGPSGRLWAFEPTSVTASFLRKSIRANGFANITLVQAGLSDKKGTAQISLNTNPELNAVTDESVPGGTYETIELMSLDECAHEYGWENIEFVKLDAEGQEHNIIVGGKHFLSTQSPLIMFELKHLNSVNTTLIDDFMALGYGMYHLVPGLNILVPIPGNRVFDPFQLNLFCCKPDRAKALEEKGLLSSGHALPDSSSEPDLSMKHLQAMPCQRLFLEAYASVGQEMRLPGWDHYERALSLHVHAHDGGRAASYRYASLLGAREEIGQALKLAVTLPRLISHVRILSELGERDESLKTANAIFNLIQSETRIRLDEPFLPASPRFDTIVPADTTKWIVSCILEYTEKAKAFSSYYTGNASLNNLEIIRQLGYQSPEMERRRQLIRMRFRMQAEPHPDPAVTDVSTDNLNPGFWKNGGDFNAESRSAPPTLEIKLKDRIHILDIGAMDIAGDKNPYEELLSTGIACVTGFEPLEEECGKLNGQGAKNRRFFPYALGDGSKRPFYITNTGMTSSIFEPNHALTSQFDNLDELMQVIRTEEIQTVRLDDIADLGDVDFIKIDVQGAEKMIFDNAPRVLKDTLVIQTEVEFVPLYKNQPLFADIDTTLRGHGFVFHKFLGYAGRLFKPFSKIGNKDMRLSQTLWAEAIYVKSFTELHNLSDQKLLKYALIIYKVYRSIDLCHHVLAEYDRRTGSSLAQGCMQLIAEGRM